MPRPIFPQRAPLHQTLLRSLPLALTLGLLAACGKPADLVVYCSLDQVFSETMIAEFEAETGLEVDARFDIEQSKTVGLVQAIFEESRAGAPRCDVFWNNEFAHTVRLGEEGLLASYASPAAAELPAAFRGKDDQWNGFAARARVLIVNTDLVEDPSEIGGLWDLFDPQWKGKVGFARPLTGTTMTHAVTLYSVLGEERAREFLNQVQAASQAGDLALVNSNGELMRKVSSGVLAWGWTDTDDFNVARENGSPVAVIYPDQEPGGMGALLIPNTIAVLSEAPHPDAARIFVDWVLRREVEERLAFSRSAQIPVREDVPVPEHVRRPGKDFRAMEVDYITIGQTMETRGEELRELFLQ